MPERTRPNARTQGLGYYLAENLAPQITQAHHHLQQERTIADGWATRGETAGRGTTTNTTTEAAALARHNIDTLADNITNAINQLQTATDQLATTIRQALRTRTPEPTQTPRCRDGQVGREGAIVWGDPTCQDIPTKAALCHNHYMASYRWRIREGIDTSRDFQEIA